jgi:ribosomal protein L19
MNQIIDVIEKELQKADANTFKVGATVRVHTRVIEGDKERIQIFAGVVIGRKGRGLNETFTVRRISYARSVPTCPSPMAQRRNVSDFDAALSACKRMGTTALKTIAAAVDWTNCRRVM